MDVLKNFKSIRQDPGASPRKLYESDSMELYLWYDPQTQEFNGFQLCYTKDNEEHSFIWKHPGLLVHERIDDGEESPMVNRTPISISDGAFDADELLLRFLEQASNLEKDVSDLVSEKILQARERKT